MTAKQYLTDIELTDINPEAQDAAKYDVQKAEINWVRISEHFLSVSVKQEHHDGRFALQFDRIEINNNDPVEDVIAFIEEEIIAAYYERYKDEDPAKLGNKYKNGLFCRHKNQTPPPKIPSMDTDEFGLKPNQFSEDGEVWSFENLDIGPEDFE